MVSKFNPEQVLKQINEIEERFPVNEWKINGILVWPYLRTALAYTQNRNPDTRKADAADERSKKSRRLMTYGKMLFSLPFVYWQLRTRLKKSTRMFLGSRAHRADIDGKLINRYYDVAAHDFQKAGELSIIMDANMTQPHNRYYNPGLLINLQTLYLIIELKRKLGGKRTYDIRLPQYDEFYNHLLATFEHKQGIKSAFVKSVVISRLKVLADRDSFLRSFLSGTSVHTAYFLCYYSSLLYPMISACNALGIHTVDIQHGGMGEGHYSYARWFQSPKEGYTLLPRFFWTWDQPSADMINRWASQTNFHRAVAAGNPWTEACLRVYNKKPPRENYILLNMTTSSLEPFLVETIRHFGDKKHWVLRMHPRHFQHNQVLRSQVEAEGIGAYVRIEDSRNVPLPVSLRHCERFISKGSGSVIEAIALGIKPILLHSELMFYYNHYIEEKRVVTLPAHESAHLIAALSSEESRGQFKPEMDVNQNRYIRFETAAKSQSR